MTCLYRRQELLNKILDSTPTLRRGQREQLLLQRLGLRRRRAKEVPHPDPARVQPQQLGRQRAGAEGHRGDPQPAPEPWGEFRGWSMSSRSMVLNKHIHIQHTYWSICSIGAE